MVKDETKKRNITADFLKGIMIFCVMYGHSISKVNELIEVTWKDSLVNVFLTTFEMPLFILISGYFLCFSLKKKNHFNVLWQRMVSIVVTLLIWEGLPVIFNFFIVGIRHGDFSIMRLLRVGQRLIFPRLWFLSCYLICCISVILVDWILSKIKGTKIRGVLGTVIYASIVIGLHFIKRYFNYVPFLFPFFIVGFELSKYNLLGKMWSRKALWGLAALFVLLYPFYKPENSFYVLGTYISDSFATVLPIFIHRFVLGLCGCSLFYLFADYLCKRAKKSRFVSFTVKLGERTMELYILSVFVQDILREISKIFIKDTSFINVLTAPLLFGPIFLIVMTALCLFINHMIAKFPKLHRILFGR